MGIITNGDALAVDLTSGQEVTEALHGDRDELSRLEGGGNDGPGREIPGRRSCGTVPARCARRVARTSIQRWILGDFMPGATE